MRRLGLLLLVAASCRPDADTRRAPELAPPPPSPPPAPQPDLVPSKTKTSTGGAVVEVGQPRFQVSAPSNIEIRPAANRLFVSDLDHVKVFELTRGTLIARFIPDAKSCPHTVGPIEVSPDGQRFIACHALVEAPFEAAVRDVDLSGYLAFSPDSRLLVDIRGEETAVTDLARRKVVRTLPYLADFGSELAFAHDGRRVIWIRSKAVLVADEGATTWRVLTTFATPWKFASVALQGTATLGRTATSLVHLDLRTGASTEIGPDHPISAISPSGERIAVKDDSGSRGSGFRILRSTGDVIATIPVSRAGDVTFANEDVIAYLDDHTIRLYDLTKGLKHFDAPSRFRGWATDTTALVERDGAWQQLEVATLATSPTTSSKHAAPPGAPAWASSWSSTPSGEPVASDLAADPPPLWDSYKDGCRETLRVWTAKGGEHQLTMPSGPHCWPKLGHPWQVSGGRIASLTERTIDVYDATTARRIAHLDVPRHGDRGGREPSDNPDLAHHYWTATLSPTGKHLALWWRRADIWFESRYTNDGWDAHPECDNSWAASFFESCHSEYYAELWSLEGKPKRIWQRRWTAKIGRFEDQPKKATSPIAFTHDGKDVLLGFSDGDILVQRAAADGPSRIETLHHAPIVRIEVSPGDTYVFSEDSDGEQRIWPLVRP